MSRLRWFTIVRLVFCLLLFALIATSMWVDISLGRHFHVLAGSLDYYANENWRLDAGFGKSAINGLTGARIRNVFTTVGAGYESSGRLVDLHVGLGIPLMVVGVWTAFAVRGDLRRRPVGHCRNCGYNLTGNVSGRCPECGTILRDRQSASR